MDENPPPRPPAGPPSQPPAGPPTVAHPGLPPSPPTAPPSVPAVPPPAAPPTYTWDAPVGPVGPAPGFRFAPHGGRLVAYIVDAVIIAAILIVAFIIFAAVGAFSLAGSGDIGGFTALIISLLAVFTFVVALGYFPWFWARTGQTPGMRMFRLRVVRDRDGGPIGAGTAIIRYIVFAFINSIVFGIPLGFLWVLFDSRRRGWHDLVAGTVVVETDR
jgi:uncharacterized RDD family membrane protein YckC